MKKITFGNTVIFTMLAGLAAIPKSWAAPDTVSVGNRMADTFIFDEAQSKAMGQIRGYKAKTRELLKHGVRVDQVNIHANEGMNIQSIECGNFERAWASLTDKDKGHWQRSADQTRAACDDLKKGNEILKFSQEIERARANPFQRDLNRRKGVALARLKRLGDWSGLGNKDIASLNAVYGSLFGGDMPANMQARQKDNMRDIQGKLQGSRNYPKYHQQTISIRRAQNAGDWAKADQLQQGLFDGMAPKDKRRIKANIQIAGSAAGRNGPNAAAQSKDFKRTFKEARHALYREGAPIKEVRKGLYKGSSAPTAQEEDKAVIKSRAKVAAGMIIPAMIALLAGIFTKNPTLAVGGIMGFFGSMAAATLLAPRIGDWLHRRKEAKRKAEGR